jgi:hypothetical protein
VLERAAGGEGTGNGEENDLPLAERLERTDGLGHAVVAKDVDLDIGDLASN